MRKTMTALVMIAAASALAAPNPGGGREAFIQQQAYDAVQRVTGQVDVLESNQNALAERVGRLERGGGEMAALKAEIDALKAEISRLRSEMQAQRKEIVDDLLKRIAAQEAVRQKENARIQAEAARQAAAAAAAQTPRGTYTVQKGDTLSLVAQAFGTTVGKLKEMNNLHSDMLRVGQKLTVPDKR